MWGLSYIGSVTGTDDQTSVQDEFHVTSTTAFCTGGGNVLAEIRGRANNLGLADVVVLDEDYLQEITNLRILVHNLGHLVDKVDDCLRHPVSRSSLASKDRNTRHHLLLLFGGHVLDGQVAVNDTE